MPDVELVWTRFRRRSTPALCCSRQYVAAHFVGATWPLRWTRITWSKSLLGHVDDRRSRRIPALLTTMSRSPKASTRRLDERSGTVPVGDVVAVGDGLATIGHDLGDDLVGGAASAPGPSFETPRSLTTTRAPFAARRRACGRGPVPDLHRSRSRRALQVLPWSLVLSSSPSRPPIAPYQATPSGEEWRATSATTSGGQCGDLDLASHVGTSSPTTGSSPSIVIVWIAPWQSPKVRHRREPGLVTQDRAAAS